MFRLTTHNKSRIPNRLAFFAAVMLVISALAGTSLHPAKLTRLLENPLALIQCKEVEASK